MHLIRCNHFEGRLTMSQKRDKGFSQQGKNYADSAGTGKRMIAAEELEKALHPTKRQNSEQS